MSGAGPQDREVIARHLAEREYRCPVCGYELKGSGGDTCPECGLKLKIFIVGSKLRNNHEEYLPLTDQLAGAYWFERFGLISVACGFGFQAGAYLVNWKLDWLTTSWVFDEVTLIVIPCIATLLLVLWIWKRRWIVSGGVIRAFWCSAFAWAATLGLYLIVFQLLA